MNHRVLQPGVHLLTRADGALQLGIDPRRSVLVPATSAPALMAAIREGAPAEVLEPFLAPTITDATTLDPVLRLNLAKHPVSGAAATQVRVHGAGRLGMTIALLLTGSGLPHVRLIDPRPVTLDDITPWGASRIDVGARRDQVCAAIMERVRRDALHRQSHPEHTERHLVVYAADQRADWPWVDVAVCDQWLSRDVPHIVATTAGAVGAVSHVIEPGATACARCAFHMRCDRDRDWPLIDTQVAGKPSVDSAPLPVVLDTAMRTVARVVTWLNTADGGAQGLTLVTWPDGGMEVEPWHPHPLCGCSWDTV